MWDDLFPGIRDAILHLGYRNSKYSNNQYVHIVEFISLSSLENWKENMSIWKLHAKYKVLMSAVSS